jgi:hypothetical protein
MTIIMYDDEHKETTRRKGLTEANHHHFPME